ncbi:hypothetical protein HYT51_02685 [Candidatus Woesearchaeota archaeon]|nr:hypothetical protein [Candidatus Woesearchaeota archaeon]
MEPPFNLEQDQKERQELGIKLMSLVERIASKNSWDILIRPKNSEGQFYHISCHPVPPWEGSSDEAYRLNNAKMLASIFEQAGYKTILINPRDPEEVEKTNEEYKAFLEEYESRLKEKGLL